MDNITYPYIEILVQKMREEAIDSIENAIGRFGEQPSGEVCYTCMIQGWELTETTEHCWEIKDPVHHKTFVLSDVPDFCVHGFTVEHNRQLAGYVYDLISAIRFFSPDYGH